MIFSIKFIKVEQKPQNFKIVRAINSKTKCLKAKKKHF